MHMDVARLGEFTPFDALKKDNLTKMLGQLEVLQASSGQMLFKKGDNAKKAIYVISGTVAMRDGDRTLGTIVGGDEPAKNPLVPALPRSVSALAVDEVHYFTIDSEILDVTLTLDQTGIYEVGDFSTPQTESEDDWMTAMLQLKLFQSVPPQNIQMIFMRMQRTDFKAGDVVVRQGEIGDYFYYVRSGHCMVTRETPGGVQDINLAELRRGATFGEEALISDSKRNATITMLSDGILMRLGRDDFESLLTEPSLERLEYDQAIEATSNGSRWIDVRLPSEFKAFNKEGSLNLPLYMLRHKLEALDSESHYIVCCDTERRSSAAAFILNQRGFNASVLKGGLLQQDSDEVTLGLE